MAHESENSGNALGFILVGEGHIDRGQLYEGLRRHTQTGEHLGAALLALGYLDKEALTQALAVQAHAPALTPGTLLTTLKQTREIQHERFSIIETDVPVIVLGEHDQTMHVAVTDVRGVAQLHAYHGAQDSIFAVYVVSDAEFAEAQRFLQEPASAPGESAHSPSPEQELIKEQPCPFGLTPIGFYDATEALFSVDSPIAVGQVAASALLHFFPRVAFASGQDCNFMLHAHTSAEATRTLKLDEPLDFDSPFYGASSEESALSALAGWLEFDDGPSLLAARWLHEDTHLIVFGAHNPNDELYGDLEDVSALLREVESALALLNNPPKPD